MKKRIKNSQAVSAFIYRRGKFLVLKAKDSKWWMPPGGRVEKGEFLIDGLRREVREETGLKKIKVLMPLIYWRGLHDDSQREGISFLCLYQGGRASCSSEHCQIQWLTLAEIKKLKITHDPEHFLLAEKIIKLLKK